MVALSRWVGCLALLVACAAALRRQRHAGSKFIAGVPVLNFQQAGADPASEEEQDWAVVVKENVSDDSIQKMCQAAKSGCTLSGNPSRGGVPFLAMRGTESDLEAVVEAGSGAVKFVEPDQLMYATLGAADDLDSHQPVNPTNDLWGLARVGSRIRPPGLVGAGVSIFVADTGIRPWHKEFRGGGDARHISTLDMTSGSLVECNGAKDCAVDRHGHGTHVAATAAGLTIGVAPYATIRSVKVLNDQAEGQWSWLYGALDWIARSGIRPAVTSVGWSRSGTQNAARDAIDAATRAGVVVVVAAGDDFSDSCGHTPAFVSSAITVGSIRNTEPLRMSTSSNYGACANIWAPGDNVKTASHTNDFHYVVRTGGGMACAHVAGGVAMALSEPIEGRKNYGARTTSAMSRDQVLDKLLADGSKNYVADLFPDDTNVVLYVGRDAPLPKGPFTAPPPSPNPSCNPEFSSGPREGDCECHRGLYCYDGGKYGCPYRLGGRHSRYFSWNCTTCLCKEWQR